jgi:hypothetical protein
MLLSRGELVAASKPIVSHLRRFSLTIHYGRPFSLTTHAGSMKMSEDSNTETIQVPRPGQELSDMEDIEIDEECFLSFYCKVQVIRKLFRA